MYICELDRPWLESPFAFQGFPLQNETDVKSVQKVCEYVMVDVSQSDPEAFRAPLHEHTRAAIPAQTQDDAPAAGFFGQVFNGLLHRRQHKKLAAEIQQSVTHSLKSVEETESLVLTIMDDVRLGKVINTPKVKAAVAETVEQIIHDQDAMLLLSSIKNKDHYTREHSLNVAILTIVLGRKLGMPREELEELGLAGMLHDVGKLLTPDEILKKPGRLSPEEFLVMKRHPTQGRDILLSSGITGVALEVAHSHHERLDGSGYPRGLKEENTPLCVKMVAIADTFDAITSDRVYGTGRTNIEAFKILQAGGGNHYDSKLVSEFIEAIGVYPPGTVVQLSNGAIGLVVRTNPASKLHPVVLVLKDRQLHPVSPRYVNLAQSRGNGRAPLQIAHMLRAKDVGIDTQIARDQRLLAALGG